MIAWDGGNAWFVHDSEKNENVPMNISYLALQNSYFSETTIKAGIVLQVSYVWLISIFPVEYSNQY